jgi:muramoyltetrapeptide carboxypeptidase
MIQPPFLKPRNSIGITCPAGYMEYKNAETAIHTLQKWGYDVMVGKTLGSKSKNYFSGTDETRTNELQAMLDDPGIDAILCGRGGYGLGRIIDALDFSEFVKKPKWIIGFSDITVLHARLNKLGIASIHGPMAAAFNNNGYKNSYIKSLKDVLEGKKMSYIAKPHPYNRAGKITGELVGGNLSLVAHLAGTKDALDAAGKILFLEDVGEYIYNVDRMLYQLKRNELFDALGGLVLGGFTDMKDTTRPFGKKINEVLKEMFSEYKFPVCYKFPVSHDKENVALKMGGTYTLSVTGNQVYLKER